MQQKIYIKASSNLDDEAVPQRPLLLVVLGARRLDRVREGHEGQSEVGEAVLVQVHLQMELECELKKGIFERV